MAEEVEEWRTKDMALIAYLCMKGFKAIRLDHEPGWKEGSVFWHFADSDELHDEIDTYLQGDARVEPSAYNAQFSRLRGEMFDFLTAIGIRRRTI